MCLSVCVSSCQSCLWVTQVDEVKEGAEVGASKFSIFSRKKVDPVPIYTNIVPCVVIDFRTEDLMEWTFIRRKLLLPVGADIAQIKLPGEDEIEEEFNRVIPSTSRISTEQRALELFEA